MDDDNDEDRLIEQLCGTNASERKPDFARFATPMPVSLPFASPAAQVPLVEGSSTPKLFIETTSLRSRRSFVANGVGR